MIKVRRFAKPLAFLAMLGLYLTGVLALGLVLFLTNPLTDQRLPLGSLFALWPYVMLVSFTGLVWRHRERPMWWLAAAIGVAPLVGLALVKAGVLA